MSLRMRDALNRYHIRQAHLWLLQRRIPHVVISGSAFKIGRRIIYYPMTGGVRVGRMFESERGLHVLGWVLEEAGLLHPEAPLIPLEVVRAHIERQSSSSATEVPYQ